MGSSEFEFVIIGQGIAGTTMAWRLLSRGQRVLLVDRETGNSASRVAAGLITPVTGKRLAKSWRIDEVYPAAVAFYRELEKHAGQSFLYQRPSLRLFQNEDERQEYHRRSSDMIAGLVRDPLAPVNGAWFNAPLGGFEMPGAARLDVPSYLDWSREYFRQRDGYRTAEIDLHRDLELRPTLVRLPRLDVSCKAVIFCRGFDAAADPWFGSIRFNAAKGEILTLQIPDLHEERVVHRGIWLAPLCGGLYRAGSTYVWDDLQTQSTTAGRAEIERRLRLLLRVPFEVVDHQAGVRPVIDAGYPALGRHPAYPQLAYFNGLGSKGSLLAPFFADQLVACLLGEREPDPEVNVMRHLGRHP